MFAHVARLIVTHARVVTALLVLLSLVAIWGYIFQRQGPSKYESTDQVGGVVQTSQRSRGDVILVLEVQDFFRPATVAALRDVAETLASDPAVADVTWVDTIPNLNIFGLADPLLPRNDASPEHFDRSRQRTLAHPLVRGQLLSVDAQTATMLVRLKWWEVYSDEDATSALRKRAEDALARHPDAAVERLRLTGRVPLYLASQRSMDRNRQRSMIISYTLTFVIALLLFRSLRVVLIVGGAPALAVFWTLGILDLLDELANPLTSAIIPVLITMVGLTDGVHLMVAIRGHCQEGLSPREAAIRGLTRIGPACFLTSLTTAIGFAALMLASSVWVRGFGRACSLGVVLTFISIITVVPIASASRWSRVTGRIADLGSADLNRFRGFIGWVVRHSRLVTMAAVATTILFTFMATKLRPDDHLRDTQPTGSEAYAALQHCDEHLGGVESVLIVATWPTNLSDESPEIVRVLQAVEAAVNTEPLLQHALSMNGLLATFPGDNQVEERLNLATLLPPPILERYFDVPAREALVTARVRDLGIAAYEPVFERLESKFEELSIQYPGFEFRLAGGPIRRGRVLYEIVRDLTVSLVTASLIIFLVLVVAFRSLRIGLIAMVPNLFPLAATGALLSIYGQSLDLSAVCSFTVCLGIAVDDTIHFLTWYQEERRRGRSAIEAVQGAFVGVGNALIMTTLILITGFSTVLMSDLPGHRIFAIMACSTIFAALLADLIFLPALLVVADRRQEVAEAAPPSTRAASTENSASAQLQES